MNLKSSLAHWEPMELVRRPQFNTADLRKLDRAAGAFNPARRVIVFLALENPYATLGGLGTITRYLPAAIAARNEKVIFITPFYSCNEAIKQAVKSRKLKKVTARFSIKTDGFCGKAFCYQDTTAPVPSYYLGIDRFLKAIRHPYDHADQNDLLYDSLAFCSAVPALLSKLGYKSNILFQANDWETAPIALTAALAAIDGTIFSFRSVLTLHNSFDCGLPRPVMHRFFGRLFAGETVLQAAVPFFDAPLIAVSEPFGKELLADPLQQLHFIPHLQTMLRNTRIVGIENGLFGSGEPAFSPTVLTKAKRGAAGVLLTAKQKFRSILVNSIGKRKDYRITGTLRFGKKPETVPIFFMMGRLDIMQKGFDVVFNAFKAMKRGSAKLFFCPSLAPGQPADVLAFFKTIAHQCAGDITIWPFRLSAEEYEGFLRGASFMLMPSLYEPFGAASEGYLNGTPVVARATGGLKTQVVPLSSVNNPGSATGILFKEALALARGQNEWRTLLALPLAKRMTSPLYVSMVHAAKGAIENAIAAYNKESCYAAMIVNGIGHLKKFKWKTSAAKYAQVYDRAGER